jgi:hypothetical protein
MVPEEVIPLPRSPHQVTSLNWCLFEISKIRNNKTGLALSYQYIIAVARDESIEKTQ